MDNEELYKQLQHLKQENEALGKAYNELINTISLENYNRLKQENEELKAKLRPFEDSYFNGLSPIAISELAKKSIRITTENRKLEDILEEIREIAKHNQFYDARYFMMRGEIGQVQNTRMTEIYEKCNEVLND